MKLTIANCRLTIIFEWQLIYKSDIIKIVSDFLTWLSFILENNQCLMLSNLNINYRIHPTKKMYPVVI